MNHQVFIYPPPAWKLILAYCDDSMERRRDKLWKSIRIVRSEFILPFVNDYLNELDMYHDEVCIDDSENPSLVNDSELEFLGSKCVNEFIVGVFVRWYVYGKIDRSNVCDSDSSIETSTDTIRIVQGDWEHASCYLESDTYSGEYRAVIQRHQEYDVEDWDRIEAAWFVIE